jgi:hypothetical protein
MVYIILMIDIMIFSCSLMCSQIWYTLWL